MRVSVLPLTAVIDIYRSSWQCPLNYDILPQNFGRDEPTSLGEFDGTVWNVVK